MTRQLFRAINGLFRPNDKDDIAREEPISLKKLRKGDNAWITKKVILGWTIDTAKQVITIPEDRKSSLLDLLDTAPPSASQFSRRRWHKLLGTLRSTVPAIAGAAGMFTRLQHALKRANGRRIILTTPVQKESTVWRHVVASLATRTTHLREIWLHPPTWIGDTDAYLTGMGGVCHNPNGDWHVWRITFSSDIRANILTDKNPTRFLTINNLELAAYIAHLHLFAPRRHHLNTYPQGWTTPPQISGPTGAASAQLPPSVPYSENPRG